MCSKNFPIKKLYRNKSQPFGLGFYVENNLLSSKLSAKRDGLAEKVKKGDKTLKTAKEFLELEGADQRSDELVALFNKDPAAMNEGDKAELSSYLRIYAVDMQAQYGDAVT